MRPQAFLILVYENFSVKRENFRLGKEKAEMNKQPLGRMAMAILIGAATKANDIANIRAAPVFTRIATQHKRKLAVLLVPHRRGAAGENQPAVGHRQTDLVGGEGAADALR